MTWQPEPRPEWILAINRGDVPLIAETASRPLGREELLSEARAALGLDSSAGIGAIEGDDSFLDQLAVLLRALEDEAELTLIGRWLTRRFLVRILEVRFQIAAYLRSDPGVTDEVVAAPLLVTGAPRSGTTILFGVLDCDPAFRAPQGWELLRPVPPPSPETHPDVGRVLLADRELRKMQAVVSSLGVIHEYGAMMPKECVSAMSLAFLSEEFTARYHVPSYAEYLETADMRPAYEAHRLVLQLLQRRYKDVRWLLKSPVHLRSLPTLLDAYPDARIAVTHRDPLKVLPSVTSLVATLRWVHSDRVDFAELGRYHSDLYQDELDNLVLASQDGTLPTARTFHGHYADFVSDPLAAVTKLYAHFGFALEPRVEATMKRFLAGRPKDARGSHDYAFADLGLDYEAERARFGPYQSWFGVPVER
jgi:hypothetical protein